MAVAPRSFPSEALALAAQSPSRSPVRPPPAPEGRHLGELFAQVVPDHRDECRRRYGEQAAHHTGQGSAEGHRQQHDGGVQTQSAALDHRLEDVPLQLLHHEDDRQHDQGVGQAVRHQGDEDRDETGEHRAHDRDERGHESQHGQGKHQRHPQNPQAGADEYGVQQADERLGANERAQRVPAALRDRRNVRGQAPGKLTGQPGKEPRPVLEEEEHQEQGQNGSHQTVQNRAHPRDQSGDDAAHAVLDPGDRGVRGLRDLVVTDVQRRT